MVCWRACWAGNDVDRQGATKLAEALAGNNALTSLELSCEHLELRRCCCGGGGAGVAVLLWSGDAGA